MKNNDVFALARIVILSKGIADMDYALFSIDNYSSTGGNGYTPMDYEWCYNRFSEGLKEAAKLIQLYYNKGCDEFDEVVNDYWRLKQIADRKGGR